MSLDLTYLCVYVCLESMPIYAVWVSESKDIGGTGLDGRK